MNAQQFSTKESHAPGQKEVKNQVPAAYSDASLSVASGDGQRVDDRLSAQALAKEKEIQEAQKNNDWEKFADLLSDDLVAIDEDGIHGRKELLDAIKAADIRFSDYKMEDVRVIPEGNGAIVAYKQTLAGTEHGKAFTWRIYTHSHWQRRGGKWLLTMFQDSMAKEQK